MRGRGARVFHALLFLWLLPRPGLALEAEGKPPLINASIGGRVKADYALGYGADINGDFAAFSLAPILSLATDYWEARFAAAFIGKTLPTDAHIDLEEARVQFWIGDYVTLRAGYGLDYGIAAEAFPQTLFFGPADPLSRFETGICEALRRPEASVSITAAGSF